MVRKLIVFFIIFAIFVFIFDFILVLLEGEPVSRGPIRGTDYRGYLESDMLLGQIPHLPIQSLTLETGSRASYSLEIGSELPEFPTTANVYKIDRPTETLSSVAGAQATAASLGFDPDAYQTTSDDILFWTTENQGRSFTYHKVLDDYFFEVDLSIDEAALEKKPLDIERTDFANASQSLISSIGIRGVNFSQSTVRIDYISINQDGSYTRYVQPREAEYVRIALYKAVESSSIDENYSAPQGSDDPRAVLSEVRSKDYLGAPATMVVQGNGAKADEDLLEFDYTEFSISSRGIYTLITPQEAWLNIQANLGKLYWLRPEDKDVFAPYEQVSVTRFEAFPDKTRIIYIEPGEWDPNQPYTQFLQPFYIFEGIATLADGRDAEFAFIIEALNNSSYASVE